MAKNHRFVTTKPDQPHVITAHVKTNRQISPNMRRLTFTGPDLAKFRYLGYDQWLRLFLARPDQESLTLPTRSNALWYAQYLMTSKEKRPLVRNYTVRDWRDDGDEGPELDIDFVTHDDHPGPAAEFALHAESGACVGILDQGLIYEPDRPEQHRLLVSDESGLPAIAGIVGRFTAETRAEVFIEIPHTDDRQELDEPAGVNVTWLVRGDSTDRPGRLAAETVREATFPTDSLYAFLVGEQALATGLRRHLVNEKAVPKGNVTFIGYWRHGVASPS